MSIQVLSPSIARTGHLLTRAYSHDIRIKMLELLKKHGSLCVSDFYEKDFCINHIGERLEQSITSQHLAILRRAKLVKSIREGKFIKYELNSENLERVNAAIIAMSELLPEAEKAAA